jgi:hypothetical protein
MSEVLGQNVISFHPMHKSVSTVTEQAGFAAQTDFFRDDWPASKA